MSDPRAYEQHFEMHMRGHGSQRARLLALEHRVAELTGELADREREWTEEGTELARLRGEERGREAEKKAMLVERERAAAELRIVAAERDAAIRDVDRRAVAVELLEGRVAELEALFGESRDSLRADNLVTRRIADLQRAIEEAEAKERRTASEYGGRVRELEQLVSTLGAGLTQTKADVNRAASSRAWRWGHSATRVMRRVTLRRNVTEGALSRVLSRIEQLENVGRPLPAAEAPAPAEELPPLLPDERNEETRRADRAALAVEIRDKLGPPPEMASWPPVSIIVPTRDGIAHLERLVEGLELHTEYPEIELIVVDNDSGDGSREYLRELKVGFPVRTIANTEPASFSRSNAQGAAEARHDLLLFLNNDVEPFEPGWLRELVAAHNHAGVAAVGATLLHAEAGNEPSTRDVTVQHRAIKFRNHRGVQAYNACNRESLYKAGFGLEDRGAAVTAACMLLARDRFETAGGFSEDYRFGTEDVDLGLKLTKHGDAVVASGRAVLYHRESASQDREGRDFKRSNRLLNKQVFLERWGGQVRRAYRLGRLHGDRFWTDGQGPHAAITVTSGDPADGWGDLHTARELGDALTKLGWRITYVERKGERWYDLPDDLDYLISLMDPFDLRKVPAEVTTIAWIRNWTERWLERPWFDRADVLLTSSQRSAELIEEATRRTTFSFPLATNPARFSPQPVNPDLASDLVFTGNHWGEDRDIQAGMVPRKGERLDVYGRGWDEIREIAPHARGMAAYEDLPGIYSSAKLVLDDTSGPTLPYGAVNSRVFDALASGTLALSNCETGIRELFGEDYPTWNSPESLRARVDALLADDDSRENLSARFRSEVLKRHTYAHRARRLVEILEEHERSTSFCIKIGAPSWEEAERWGDLHFARSLVRDLRGRGHRCLIQVLDEWENSAGLTYDVAIVLRGLSRHHPKPGQFNILWVISHPEDVTGEECDGYDLVCVASATFAEKLAETTTTPVRVLEQATDPTVFHRDPNQELAHDLVYVANSRNVLRPIVRDLLPTEHDLAIIGGNWDGLIDTRYVVRDYVPNDELRNVYSSARVVLCDHWDDMRTEGFVSNRIYDALACGATVISDNVAGLAERFPGVVHTYESAEDLRALVDYLLASEPNPHAAQAAVADFTFGVRAKELQRYIREHLDPTSIHSPENAPQPAHA